MNCLQCNHETCNPKFCSRRCSAIYTNKVSPKRMKTKKCKCGTAIRSQIVNCLECRSKKIAPQKRALGYFREKFSLLGKHPSWIHAHVRSLCREWHRSLTQKPCARCGYDKHVELAHIKGLSEFTDDVLLEEVNSTDNVIQLCRNCHWEMDNHLWCLTDRVTSKKTR